jgi:hypothetical protein
MKPYHAIDTDYLRKHACINSATLSREGILLDFCLDEVCHEITIPPFMAATVLCDTGFIEGRRPTREGEGELEVQLELEGEETTRTVWVSWESFVMSYQLPQYFALLALIEYLQREAMKAAYWEIMSVSSPGNADLN